MKRLIDCLPAGVAVFDAEKPHKALYANEVYLKGVGFTQEELLKTDINGCNRVIPEERHIIEEAMETALEKGYSGEYECRMMNGNGVYWWYVFSIHYIEESEDGTVFVMCVWDVNERKQVEEELYIQTERYKLMEMITGELPFDYDVEKDELLVSDKYLSMRNQRDGLEYYVKERKLEDIFHKQDIELFEQSMEQASRQEIKDALELRVNMGNESGKTEYAWHRLLYKSIPGMEGNIIRIVGSMTNINQEKLEHYQLAEQVKKDSLTGLLNKTATREEVEAFLQEGPGQRHALFIIDIDNFKYINDIFGHLFGDTILISAAEKIDGVFRKEDIVGRVGGDEFLVFMKNVERELVVQKADRLCRELKQTYQGEKEAVTISCSVGIAFYDKDGSTYEELFEKADHAMYQAKDAGKNQYRLFDGENQKVGFRERTRKENREETKAIKLQDESLLSASFMLLSHARNVNSSLNLLLERIGRRYELDVVAVLQDCPETQEFIQTNCWRGDKGIVNAPIYRDKYDNWKFYMTGFDERGLLCIDAYDSLSSPEGQVRLHSGRRIGALINCRYRSQGGKTGIVTFCNMGKTRKWSEFEKETFFEISKIISVFVSLKNNQLESQQMIRSLRSRDLLTGLLNEDAFKEAVREKLNALEPGLQYAMVYTDIRDFSYVNENFGNEAGNQILRELGKAISTATKVLSCRLHSDLFVSLVWDEDKETIRRTVEQTVNDFTREQQKKYPQGNLRLIAGIYFMDSPCEDVEVAIENANLTRKSMKSNTSGSACQIYTPDLRASREHEKRIISGFEKALKEGEFLVYIQPKFELESLELSGGEALVRWLKRDGSIELPGEFIPVLEKSGYIVNMDFYVLEQVLKYMQKWKERGKSLKRISVNFSRKHFEGNGIYHRVRELTERYGIEHRFIEIEVTESLLVEGLDIVQKEMELLRSDGFFVAIDDFGTGYSSLSVLYDMPADVVKIDKSFLDRRDIEKGKNFIEKVGALVHSVKEEVVFEGIETHQQLSFLVDCGFQYGQGYLYDEPLPIDVFEEKYMN